MKFINNTNTHWQHGNRSGSIEDPFYTQWVADGNAVDAYVEPVIDFDAEDLAALNNILAQDGSVVRALAEIMFTEINDLRANVGLNTYTKTQFVNALKSKMRT